MHEKTALWGHLHTAFRTLTLAWAFAADGWSAAFQQLRAWQMDYELHNKYTPNGGLGCLMCNDAQVNNVF